MVADLQKQLVDLTAKLQKARATLEEKQQLREKAAKEHEDAVARCGAGQQQTAEERGETIKPTIEQLVGLSGHLKGDPELQQAFKVIQAGNDKLKKAWDKHHAAEAERKAEAGQQESDQAAMDEDVQDFLPEDGRKKRRLQEKGPRGSLRQPPRQPRRLSAPDGGSAAPWWQWWPWKGDGACKEQIVADVGPAGYWDDDMRDPSANRHRG